MSWPTRSTRPERPSGTPLYEIVVLELVEALFADPPPGDKLPPEPELCERLAVSRTTLRRALDELETRGIVIRRQGLGTFFVGGNPLPAIPDLMSSSDVLRSVPGFAPRCLVFETIPADARLAANLELDEGALIHHLTRLDRVGHLPVALIDAYLPHPLLAHVTPAQIEQTSIYELLDQTGLPVSHAEQIVYADTWTPKDAQLLDVEPGQATLILRRKTYNHQNTPIEYAVMRYRQRTFHIEMQLSRLPQTTSINLTTNELDTPLPAG
jgi:GntR family transcriptional regulator